MITSHSSTTWLHVAPAGDTTIPIVHHLVTTGYTVWSLLPAHHLVTAPSHQCTAVEESIQVGTSLSGLAQVLSPTSKTLREKNNATVQLIELRWLEKYLIEQWDSLVAQYQCSPIHQWLHPHTVAMHTNRSRFGLRQRFNFKSRWSSPTSSHLEAPRVTKLKISARLNVNENYVFELLRRTAWHPKAAICRWSQREQ